MLWDQFHFLRPLWLTMIIPAVLILVLLRQKLEQKNSWKQVIAPHLLTPLLEAGAIKNNKPPLYLLLAAWIIACLSLAGPTWEKVPVPVTKPQQPLVVVADMTMNMLATDSKPNRLARLKYKLLDLFKERKEGLTALVVYAGSAHTIAPLTDDSKTLTNLLKALSPDIMPAPGNNPSAGIEAAINLIQQGTGQRNGHILLITDQVTESETQKIELILRGTVSTLSIIGIGSTQGAPISLGRGGFLKDSHGKIVIPQLERDNLMRLVNAGKGVYQDLTIDNTDLNATLPKITKNTNSIEVERQFDQWHDVGFWLVLCLLPFSLGAFRKGWLTIALLAILYPQAQPTMALDWQSLWINADQRGANALKKGHLEEAAKLFENNQWKAEALYQAKSYKEAAQLLSVSNSPEQLYNKGNALAQSQQLKEAVTAYKQALEKLDASNVNNQSALQKDIRFNKSLVEKLLQEQEKQQQNQKDRQNQNNNEKQKDKDQQKNQNDQQSQQNGQDQ
ncbi:VWA domain-containing protein, partial [Endozoicomonas sp.]|nr:VWA domain-containing protein [Endozoicomonas sp.]